VSSVSSPQPQPAAVAPTLALGRLDQLDNLDPLDRPAEPARHRPTYTERLSLAARPSPAPQYPPSARPRIGGLGGNRIGGLGGNRIGGLGGNRIGGLPAIGALPSGRLEMGPLLAAMEKQTGVLERIARAKGVV
jgi:hypothetical protein